jgi:WD40 repeat protein
MNAKTERLSRKYALNIARLNIKNKKIINSKKFDNFYDDIESSDKTINIYDCSSVNTKIKPIKKLSFHVDSIDSIIAIDNGNYLLSSGRDDKLCLWDIKEILENYDTNKDR